MPTGSESRVSPVNVPMTPLPAVLGGPDPIEYQDRVCECDLDCPVSVDQLAGDARPWEPSRLQVLVIVMLALALPALLPLLLIFSSAPQPRIDQGANYFGGPGMSFAETGFDASGFILPFLALGIVLWRFMRSFGAEGLAEAGRLSQSAGACRSRPHSVHVCVEKSCNAWLQRGHSTRPIGVSQRATRVWSSSSVTPTVTSVRPRHTRTTLS